MTAITSATHAIMWMVSRTVEHEWVPPERSLDRVKARWRGAAKPPAHSFHMGACSVGPAKRSPAAILRKSAAFRLAPPTRAPSTPATCHEFLRIIGLYRAAVEQPDGLGCRSKPPGKRLDHGLMHLGDLRGRGGASRADSPDRLIGDDRRLVRRQVGDRPGQLGRDHGQGPPLSRCSRLSPTQMMGVRPAR
jgi:hypothetical protein